MDQAHTCSHKPPQHLGVALNGEGPESTSAGYILVLISGLRVPMLLRLVESDFEVVGFAYNRRLRNLFAASVRRVHF